MGKQKPGTSSLKACIGKRFASCVLHEAYLAVPRVTDSLRTMPLRGCNPTKSKNCDSGNVVTTKEINGHPFFLAAKKWMILYCDSKILDNLIKTIKTHPRMRRLCVQTLLSISRDTVIPWQMGEVRGNSVAHIDHYFQQIQS